MPRLPFLIIFNLFQRRMGVGTPCFSFGMSGRKSRDGLPKIDFDQNGIDFAKAPFARRLLVSLEQTMWDEPLVDSHAFDVSQRTPPS